MGFSPAATVATSFAIQCFGMTAGAITWWRFHVAQSGDDVQPIEHFDEISAQRSDENDTRDKRATETLHITQWQSLYPVLLLSIPASIVGLLIAQFNLAGLAYSPRVTSCTLVSVCFLFCWQSACF